ncbi:RICIN domain-containing protein [Treponema sp. J25]|uniref:RICIN domain-containing protein n=1 Tax=Treponema sp. J25 TaxID=2094121 RepID=UPI0014053628|nr:RICIN domain-containing protein [Treponema sp. J25]
MNGKRYPLLFMAATLLGLLASCNLGTLESPALAGSPDLSRAITGPNGSIDVTGMTGTSMTVTYNAGSQISSAKLYVSEGNGTGLVLAAREMNYSGGVYSYTLSHPTFTAGAKIYLTVLKNVNGVETCVPQGTLANTLSWASITYGASSSDTSSGTPATLASGATYTLVAKCSGKALDVAEWSTTAGTIVHQWTLGNNQANQQWVITSTGDGYWYIKSVHSGYVLDVKDWSLEDGAQIVQWYWGNQANQKWKIELMEDGYYRLTNQHSGKVLDVSGASTQDGAKVQQWTNNDTSAQRWKITQVTGSSSGGGTVTPEIPGYRLVWADEFDGTALNGNNWVYDIGTGSGGWGNNEQQYYTNRSQNVSVSDGMLKITALRENYNGSAWTSARIKTQGKREFTYGRITARIKLPNGTALWPAFWMLGSNIPQVSWPACGEIDIMEHINSEATVHGTIHWDSNGHASWGQPTNNNYWNNFNVDVTQWHEYTIEWDSSSIKWYVDGKQFMEANIANGVNSTEEFHRPFFFIINLAVGGQWPGYPDGSTPSSASMYVDYVRVYQK